VDMREATVTGASFTGCTFREVKFNASVFRDAAFTNCTFVKMPNVTNGVKVIVYSNCKIAGSTVSRTITY